MRNRIAAGVFALAFAGSALPAGAAQPTPEQNKETVRALMEAFARRDADTVARYTADGHAEHNANLTRNGPCGKTCLIDFLRSPQAQANAETGGMRPLRFLAADRDYVIAMFEDQPENGIQLEVFRLEGGKMAEHWIARQ